MVHPLHHRFTGCMIFLGSIFKCSFWTGATNATTLHSECRARVRRYRYRCNLSLACLAKRSVANRGPLLTVSSAVALHSCTHFSRYLLLFRKAAVWFSKKKKKICRAQIIPRMFQMRVRVRQFKKAKGWLFYGVSFKELSLRIFLQCINSWNELVMYMNIIHTSN